MKRPFLRGAADLRFGDRAPDPEVQMLDGRRLRLHVALGGRPTVLPFLRHLG